MNVKPRFGPFSGRNCVVSFCNLGDSPLFHTLSPFPPFSACNVRNVCSNITATPNCFTTPTQFLCPSCLWTGEYK
jgi:hypothetical protein